MMVFGFQDDHEPAVVKFQSGYIWPHFTLNRQTLTRLGILSEDNGDQAEYFKIYDAVQEIWMEVQVGHVETVEPGVPIFLRATTVSNCPGFADLLSSSIMKGIHQHYNLASLRKTVRTQMQQCSSGGR